MPVAFLSGLRMRVQIHSTHDIKKTNVFKRDIGDASSMFTLIRTKYSAQMKSARRILKNSNERLDDESA